MTDLTLIQKIAVWALPLIFAITLHEVCHGYVASLFGDQTARLSGRLSLNPVKHIDLLGTIVVPMVMLVLSNFIFGWAKPVPVDPRNFKKPRFDMAIVALAGPLANLAMAFCWGALAKIGMLSTAAGYVWMGEPLRFMADAGILINVVLAVLNLLPFPPLDGGKIFSGLLPKRWAFYLDLIEPYSFFILVAMLLTGVLSAIMNPPVLFLVAVINALFGLGLWQA